MTETPSAQPLTIIPLAELRHSYPSTELLSRPVLNEAGEQVGFIEDLMMKDDHLAFAILSVGDFVGVSGRRVVVAFQDLSIVDKEFMLAGATRDSVNGLTIYDRGFAAPDGVLLRKPRHGQKDTGHIVAGALGEPMPGAIADVSDGDR
jgi:sporulation protein YlmC with PRC-barrel domain